MDISKPLVVFLPDTRGVVVSPFGRGNLKIGPDVYTYSRLPGLPDAAALGSDPAKHQVLRGTCPGASDECQAICYAARPVAEDGAVYDMWARNSRDVGCDGSLLPEIPADARLIRLHISGDFDTPGYILGWVERLKARPDVTCWAYTRSWRCESLLEFLEQLRALPNVQLFASMDVSTPELPPEGWRRAWIDGDPRAGAVHQIAAHDTAAETFRAFELQQTGDGVKALICPEETKHVKNCQECGFCISGLRNDVVFLKH